MLMLIWKQFPADNYRIQLVAMTLVEVKNKRKNVKKY